MKILYNISYIGKQLSELGILDIKNRNNEAKKIIADFNSTHNSIDNFICKFESAYNNKIKKLSETYNVCGDVCTKDKILNEIAELKEERNRNMITLNDVLKNIRFLDMLKNEINCKLLDLVKRNKEIFKS